MIKLEGALYPWRFRVVLALLALLVGAIACQIVYLQVIDHDFLKGQAMRAACGISLSLLTEA